MLETMKAEIASTGTGLQVKGSCRGFELVFDEPEASGGTDTSVNPVEGLLCAFGACQAIATLLAMGRRELVKTEQKLDKEALKQQPEEVLEAVGAYLKTTDEFFYDTGDAVPEE